MPNIAIPPSGRSVLITGSSSGIGRAAALHLAGQGYTVLATVRRQVDADALAALDHPNLVPLCPLDLTVPAHIPAIADRVRVELEARGQRGLYAVVSSAGVGTTVPVELMDPALLRAELEARVVGPVTLIQALLPLLRAGNGRILWIATPGLIAIPYVSSIHAPDYAVNCIADTLHLELHPWDIPNVLIKCGGIDTPSVERTSRELDEALSTWPAETLALYGDSLHRTQERLARFDQGRTPPEAVARIIERALLAPRPRRTYRIGSGSRAMVLLKFLPQPLIDAIFTRMV
jgi:NAD(P)-dependent dehydrogenase (short-subunit alcohol dehydrogenase family)